MLECLNDQVGLVNLQASDRQVQNTYLKKVPNSKSCIGLPVYSRWLTAT